MNLHPTSFFYYLKSFKKGENNHRRFIMDIKINITLDEEASVYIAVCDEFGLALESESI